MVLLSPAQLRCAQPDMVEHNVAVVRISQDCRYDTVEAEKVQHGACLLPIGRRKKTKISLLLASTAAWVFCMAISPYFLCQKKTICDTSARAIVNTICESELLR